MPLEYQGGLPDWCGEAANRRRLEEWYAGFGAGGIPCSVCEVQKLAADLRRLAHHLASGKERVRVEPPKKGTRRTWAVSLLAAPPAVIEGAPSPDLRVLHLQLVCSRCRHVLLFDAHAIGIAV